MKAKASVIMSVYNTKEEYLREAIDSILNQTYENIEFIIVDDASNSETKAVLASYTDSRIVLITNETNYGLTYNLNRALEKSTGEYIVRMDADDISHKDRIEKQIGYMESHNDCNVLGAYMDCGGVVRKYGDGIPWELRKTLLLFDNIGLGHPSAVFRKSFLDTYGIKYDETIKKSQDYEIWTQCIKYTNLDVYPECLMTYRIHDGQISTALSSEQKKFLKIIKSRQLNQFKPFITDEEIDVFTEYDETSKANIKAYRQIMKKIIKANKHNGLYKQNVLKFVLRKKYKTYLNYHYLNLYRFEKYILWPLNINRLKYEKYLNG